MIFVPWQLDIAPEQSEFTNLLIFALCIVTFVLSIFGLISQVQLEFMVLDGWKPLGLILHPYIHADISHLLGNLLYLWVFGNAICSKVGSLMYFVLYTFFGLFAAIVHNTIDGSTAVGASAAIYGVIGFYFALYPTNKIRCFWSFYFRSGFVEISAYLLIGFWVVGDVLGLFGAESKVAHLAHLAGFVAGLVTGLIMLNRGLIIMNDFDLKTLPEVLGK